MRRYIAFAVALLAGLAGCEDPAEPLLIPGDQIALDLRDVFVYENGGLTGQFTEFTAIVSDAVAPARLDSIAELEVLWPNGVTRFAFPLEFHTTPEGGRATSVRIPRAEGLFTGNYKLTARFVDGRDVTVEKGYVRSTRLGSAEQINFYREPTWATIGWGAPDLRHEWSVRIERRSPEPVDTLARGPSGSAAGGGFGAGLDYDFQAGVLYAFVLELSNDYTTRSYAYLFNGP